MIDLVESRPELDNLKSYAPLEENARIVLSANESPFNLSESLVKKIKKELNSFAFNRYPDALASGLRKKLAVAYGVSDENIVLGNGSDELIQCLLLAYGGSGRSILTFEPTFSMYSIVSQVTGTQVYELDRTELFGIDVPRALEVVREFCPTLIFLCNPNNPTGNILSSDEIELFLKETNALVVVDEAYAEFSGQTVIPLLSKFPNLIVLRTFSKAFSLAGIRIGYMVASSGITENALKAKLPYNCDAFSQMVAGLAFNERETFKLQIKKIVSERERIIKELSKINGVTPHSSAANFVLIEIEKEAIWVWKKLLEAGILVRNFNESRLKKYLRVTVGTEEENNLFLKMLKEIVDAR
ncbi:histidinol-phosphate transaminase [Candidatus Oleimmundimicrobium sp.]|uniref:histidinol-phosphate transaminase n=1 Tax=Candidatus Oleimmundimicrobium sp. TaxID=3060597 RepID=UPI00271F58D8|nr:histidinol-phosphate transaminase [Candidatus Oleimmundimicrobium sp.]MDO8886633.1 histidinol-phosphate transaminase [Candidatus Oleimmundimicrobium sp.]